MKKCKILNFIYLFVLFTRNSDLGVIMKSFKILNGESISIGAHDLIIIYIR